MIKKDVKIKDANVLVLGITFKENCPDVRNTKVVDVVSAFKDFGVNVTIYDPWANESEVLEVYGLKSTQHLPNSMFDALVLAVAHQEFAATDFSTILHENHVIYDVKNVLESNSKDGGL